MIESNYNSGFNNINVHPCPYCSKKIIHTLLCCTNEYYKKKTDYKFFSDNFPNNEIINTISIMRCGDCKKEYVIHEKHKVSFKYSDGKISTVDVRFINSSSIKIHASFEIKDYYSPEFISSYNDALKAKFHIPDSYGILLRKSLEILVIDFLKVDTTAKERSTLGELINKIENPKIKLVAQKAAWLGNDHTHVYKKWSEYDITDLETLINLLLHHIEADHIYKKYSEEMKKPR